MKNVNINEKGRSMVEMLGVLAIIGVLSAGGLAGYSKAMFKHKLNNTIDQITMIVTNVRTLYGTQGNYKGLDNEMAVKAGIIPAAMVSSDGKTLYNPFKGTVVIEAAKAKSDLADTAFVIQYNSLPAEACVQIATSDFGTGSGSGFIGVSANSTTNAATTTPADPAPAQTGYNWIAPNGGMILDLLFPTASADGTAPAAPTTSIDITVYAGDGNEGTPLTLQQAITACNQPGTTNSVTLKFY